MEPTNPVAWEALFGTAEVRGVMGAFLLAVLSIPLAVVYELLNVVPAKIVPRSSITPILAGLGLGGMVWVALVTAFPMDLAITVGIGAGMGARASKEIPGVKSGVRKGLGGRNGGD